VTRIAANLSLLFVELPLMDRFGAAAEAGFDAVEILFPYDDPVPDLRRAMTRAGLPLALINCPPPNYTGGVRGFAAVPELRDRFRHDFRRVLRYAQELRPRHIHIMAGAAEGDAARDTFIENLRWAVAEAPEQALTIEPLNRTDNPGYFLSDYDLAAEVIEAVGADTLGLQYDSYHATLLTGDALAAGGRTPRRVSHVQISSPPGRSEPGTGLDWPALYAAIREAGYDGYVSAEYHPETTTADGLQWLDAARAALTA